MGFRYFAERSARYRRISGWVRNLPDGRVEVHAEGAGDQLADFEAALRRGPMMAEVRDFEVSEAAVTGAREFEIR